MYINRIDPQISNRTVGKPKRLKGDGEKEFSEEIDSLLDVVSIEPTDPEKRKREDKPKRFQPKPDTDGEKKVDIVC